MRVRRDADGAVFAARAVRGEVYALTPIEGTRGEALVEGADVCADYTVLPDPRAEPADPEGRP